MSQETSGLSKASPRVDRGAGSKARRVFLRLFGDVVEQLNVAVDHRVRTRGVSQADIARAADQDPAVLSRVLAGAAGTNLRTIAAILAATDYRMKISVVACETLLQNAERHRLLEGSPDNLEGAYLIQVGSNIWKEAPLPAQRRHARAPLFSVMSEARIGIMPKMEKVG